MIVELPVEPLACEVAVTVWFPAVGAAVYKPVAEIMPMPPAVLPPENPSTLQVTVWLELPLTAAANCWVPPIAMVAAAGVMTTGGDKTVSVVVAVSELPPQTASIVQDPVETPSARPLLLIVATPGVKELQLTLPVTFCELPSL